MAKAKAPLSGHEARLAWLKSLDVGDTVTAYRPAFDMKSLGYSITRSLICDTGLIVSRNRTSITVEWHDESHFSVDKAAVCRTTKVPAFGNNAGSAQCSDQRHHDHGFCIFQDVEHLEDYKAACELLSCSHRKNSLMYSYDIRIGTTAQEAEECIKAMKVCFSF